MSLQDQAKEPSLLHTQNACFISTLNNVYDARFMNSISPQWFHNVQRTVGTFTSLMTSVYSWAVCFRFLDSVTYSGHCDE